MAYKVTRHNSFASNLKNIDQQHQAKVLDACDAIQANPQIGETTKGTLHSLLRAKKHSIKSTNPQYRILYRIIECNSIRKGKHFCTSDIPHKDEKELNSCEGQISFIVCGTREMFNNLYKLPLDKLKKFL